MHKENCTVSRLMSGCGPNMSAVIYNGGLLATSTTLSGLAPQPRDVRVKGGLQEESCDSHGRTQQPVMALSQQAWLRSLYFCSPWL